MRVAIAPLALYMEWVVYLIPQLPSGGKEMRETHWGNFMPTTAQELKPVTNLQNRHGKGLITGVTACPRVFDSTPAPPGHLGFYSKTSVINDRVAVSRDRSKTE